MVKTSCGAECVTCEGLAAICFLSSPVFYRRTAHLSCQDHGCWRPIARRLMEPLLVVRPQIAWHTVARVPHALGISQIDLLRLDGPLQPLHEHIVQSPAAGIHADVHPPCWGTHKIRTHVVQDMSMKIVCTPRSSAMVDSPDVMVGTPPRARGS